MYDLDLRIPIKKVDQPKGLVTGWAALCKDDQGNPVIDHQDQIIPLDEIEKAAHDAMATQSGEGKAGDMHERVGLGDVVESMIFTREKMAALGYPGEGPEGWVVTLRIRDKDLLKSIAAGERSELSIRATTRVRKVGGTT